MTPYHPLTDTGTPPEDAAMIWPWPHNWASPVTRRPEWSTVVMTSATGGEQRQAIREYPREQVTYEHLLEGSDSAMAFALLREWKGRGWLVPDWTEATKTTAPAGAVLSMGRYSVPAGLALLGTEVVTLLDAEGTLEVAPSGSWPAGTTVVPLRPASLDADQTVSHVTGTVSRISPTFLFEDARPVDETYLQAPDAPEYVGPDSAWYAWAEGALRIHNPTMLDVGRAYTIELKIKPAQVTGYEEILFMPQSSARIFISGGYLRFRGWPSDSAVDRAITAGQMVHVAITRRTVDLEMSLFVNGALVTVWGELNSPTYSGVSYVRALQSYSGEVEFIRATQDYRVSGGFPVPPYPSDDPLWGSVGFLIRGWRGGRSRWGRDPSGAPTQDARAHMLPRAHNFSSPGSTQVSRELDELDPGVGLRHTRPRHDISTSQWSYDALLESDQDILAFRALLQQHRGSAIGMYASPPGADLEVAEIVDGLATVPGSQFWGSAPPAIDLLTPRGWECRKVASVSPAGVQLTNTGVQALPGEVATARSVHRVRLLSDAVEIRYLTLGVAEVSLPVASTPDPFDSGGGGGGGGTTGGGWAEVAVPSVTPPTPAGQVVLLVRGESWPLVDASPVGRSIAVTGIMDAYPDGSPALFGSTTAIRALMFSPFPYVTATSPTTITADGDFCAECFVRIPASGTGFGNVRAFSFGTLSFRLRDTPGSVSIYENATILANVDGVVSLGTWYHLAVTRRSGTIYIYLNGVMVLEYAYAASVNMTSAVMFRPLSYYVESVGAYFKYARITTGDSVYSGASFPPLTSGY